MGENETRFLSLSGQGFQLIRGTVMAEKKEFIRIRGARENNLKALNVDIPRNQFVVFTGLSGSGKSSLAFDTISMRRASGGTWRAFPPTRASS